MIRSYVLRLALLLFACTVSSHVMTMAPGGAPVEWYDDTGTYLVPGMIEMAAMTMVTVLPHAMRYLPFKEALLHTLEAAGLPILMASIGGLPSVCIDLLAGHDPLKLVWRPLLRWERPGDKWWLVGSILYTGFALLHSRHSLLGNGNSAAPAQ